MARVRLLERRPLLTYFVLVYVLAWAFWIPLALIHPYRPALDGLGDSMVLFHAFGNISLNTFGASGTFLGRENGTAFILYVILLWVAVTLVVVLAGPARLSRNCTVAPV